MIRSTTRWAVAVRCDDGRIRVRAAAVDTRLSTVPRPLRAILSRLAFWVWEVPMVREARAVASALRKGKPPPEETTPAHRSTVIGYAAAVSLITGLPLIAAAPLPGRWPGATAEFLVRVALAALVITLPLLVPSRRVSALENARYHGAEHMMIRALERGCEPTVAAALRFTHRGARCGTSATAMAVVVSSVAFLFIPQDPFWIALLARIAAFPVLTILAMELIRIADRYRPLAFVALPGLLAQGLTVRRGHPEALEVAAAAAQAVVDGTGPSASTLDPRQAHPEEESGR